MHRTGGGAQGAGLTEVRVMKISELQGYEELLYTMVSTRRREKALRFIQADDRLRCLAAGYLTEHCLPGWSESGLYTGREGKPFLRDGVQFSITHGGNYAALTWRNGTAGIGIDVEPVREMEYYQDILPYAMTEEEQEAAAGNAAEAARIWTRKESLYKCVGEGISGFAELPPVLEDRVFFLGAPCRFRSWEEDGHIFSLAVRGSDDPIDLLIRTVGIHQQ